MSCAGWANCNSFTVWGQVKGVAGPQNMSIFRRMHRGSHVSVCAYVCVSMCPLTARWKAKDFHPICKSGASRYAYATFAVGPHPSVALCLTWRAATCEPEGGGGGGDWQHHVPDGKSNITTLRAFQFTCENHFLFLLFFRQREDFPFYYLPYPVNGQQRRLSKGSNTWKCRFAG